MVHGVLTQTSIPSNASHRRAYKMNLGTRHIPNEILLAVAGHLPVNDIKSLRLVCNGFGAAASRYLLTSLWISPASADHERMLAVAQHPVFCNTIVEIKYDATWSIPEDPEFTPLSRAEYIRRFCGDWATEGLGLKVSKAAAIRGYKLYKQRKDEEDALARKYMGPNLTRYHLQDMLPDQFTALLEQPQNHGQVVEYLPSDLATLIKALPQMPNVRHFIVSDRRYSRTHAHYHDDMDDGVYQNPVNFAVEHQGVRGLDAFVLKPRTWISNYEEYAPMSHRQVYRGFPVMMQAMSMMGSTKLVTFSVERDSEDSGLSCQLFVLSPTELHHTLRAFSQLRHLTLKLNTMVGSNTLQRGVSFPDVMRTGALAQVCTHAEGLETLDIQLDGPSFMEEANKIAPQVTTVALEKLIGGSTWAKLTSVTLGWMELTKNDFLAFYDRQHHTLRRFILNGVTIINERGFHSSYLGPKQAWKSTFKAMAAGSTNLQYLSIDNDPEDIYDIYESDEYMSIHFASDNNAVIRRFLITGGQHGCACSPLRPGCMGDLGFDASSKGGETDESSNSKSSASSDSDL